MKTRTQGFTLIEVLVVVAIIALLISVLLPSLKQARDQSKRTVCASQLHQVGLAIQAYAVDARGWVPPYYLKGATIGGEVCTSFGNGVTSGGPSLLVRQPVGWGMTSYLPSTDALFCPSETALGPARTKGKWAPDTPITSYTPYNPNPFPSINGYTGYWYMYVSPTGQDSGDINANRPGFYDGFQRYHVDRIPVVKPGRRGNRVKGVTLMSDLGVGGLWSAYWPLTHKTGWNTLRMDTSVRFVRKAKIDSRFVNGTDIWMTMMEQFDLN